MVSLEPKCKYERQNGRAKINFLALSKKSQKALRNIYFQDRASEEKMDNLANKLKYYRCF